MTRYVKKGQSSQSQQLYHCTALHCTALHCGRDGGEMTPAEKTVHKTHAGNVRMEGNKLLVRTDAHVCGLHALLPVPVSCWVAPEHGLPLGFNSGCPCRWWGMLMLADAAQSRMFPGSHKRRWQILAGRQIPQLKISLISSRLV
jgi:hypothetical protein